MIEISPDLANKIQDLLQKIFGAITIEFALRDWDHEEKVLFTDHARDFTGILENGDGLFLSSAKGDDDTPAHKAAIKQANEELQELLRRENPSLCTCQR